MYISRIRLKNWKNFKEVDVSLGEYTYLLGANATGKSNFLDVFRFLRDISKLQGGGLQKALQDRGGISSIRCLHARNDTEVSVEVHFKDNFEDEETTWRYMVSFKNEGQGANRNLITAEKVWKKGVKKPILERPDDDDLKDDVLLTETHLEQNRTNAPFRDIATFFDKTTYLHLVPQLLKFYDQMGGLRLQNDPFGQGLLENIASTRITDRNSRLRKIQKALSAAIPQFGELKFVQDSVTGRPHIEARYLHHRPNAGWQREDKFSDGTLRLIGLLWSLIDTNTLLLLEEPELSLNDEIVRQIPFLFHKIRQQTRRKRQIVLSTHSSALLENKAIDPVGVILLEPSSEGTTMRHLNDNELKAIDSGFTIAEAVFPNIGPSLSKQLSFVFE